MLVSARSVRLLEVRARGSAAAGDSTSSENMAPGEGSTPRRVRTALRGQVQGAGKTKRVGNCGSHAVMGKDAFGLACMQGVQKIGSKACGSGWKRAELLASLQRT